MMANKVSGRSLSATSAMHPPGPGTISPASVKGGSASTIGPWSSVAPTTQRFPFRITTPSGYGIRIFTSECFLNSIKDPLRAWPHPPRDCMLWQASLEGTMEAAIGFVGLGIMGRPMAANLAKSFPVIGFDVEESRFHGATGVTRAATIAELAGQCTVVCLSLPSAAVVEEVTIGSRGLAENLSTGSLVIDLSTNLPSVSRRIAARLAEKGIAFADAPVSGGEAGAKAGALAIMVGASKATFERCMPVLSALGKSI